jgi:transposase
MPTERVSMKKIKEIIRLRFSAGLSYPQIAASLRISAGVAHKIVKRAEAMGLSWPLPDELDETALEKMLYADSENSSSPSPVMPDFAKIHQELKRKGMTLMLLWQEYTAAHAPAAYQYTRFCVLYREWRAKLKTSMRQTHRAGEKMFVDYSGQTVPIINPLNGESKPAQIFVAVLGASNYTYCEATRSQTLPDWIGAHTRAFAFFQGCPEIVVPDNLKSGVSKACRYEPDINPTYADMATHYNIAVIPARPIHPRDKAAVELGVQVIQRWVLARLRHQQFFSLAALNKAIGALLEDLNNKPMKKLNTTRRKLYEEIEKPTLKPLPLMPYQYCDWQKVKLGLDYHIDVDGHYYSVPYRLIKEKVDVRISEHLIEVLFKGKRVASHVRSKIKGGRTTLIEHMPKAHQAHIKWTISALLKWAAAVGPSTEQLVEKMLVSKKHPEQGYRSCLGLTSLGRYFTEARLEQACRLALLVGAISYQSVKSILKKKLDLLPLEEPEAAVPSQQHENLRGADYYLDAQLSSQGGAQC